MLLCCYDTAQVCAILNLERSPFLQVSVPNAAFAAAAIPSPPVWAQGVVWEATRWWDKNNFVVEPWAGNNAHHAGPRLYHRAVWLPEAAAGSWGWEGPGQLATAVTVSTGRLRVPVPVAQIQTDSLRVSLQPLQQNFVKQISGQ